LASATRVGLVTAPDGRGLLAATLSARGTAVDRADVYERVPLPLADADLARLTAALDAPACLALSSEQALQLVLAQLPPDASRVLRRAAVAAASERLAAFAASLGWNRIVLAGSPRPAALARAAEEILATKV
jgi:uroporphyrinogen-III synthase